MKLKIKEVTIVIEESLVIVGSCMIFSKFIRRYFSNFFVCYIFTLFHELSHVFVASMFGMRIHKITFTLCGLNVTFIHNMKQQNKLSIYWLMIYLAGPLSNFLLAGIFNKVPIVFEINIAIGIMNLLSIKPLDGYNIMNILLSWYFNKITKEKILKVISLTMLVVLAILAIIQLLLYKNISLLLLLLYVILMKSTFIK